MIILSSNMHSHCVRFEVHDSRSRGTVMIIFRQRGYDWYIFRCFAHVTITLGLVSIVLHDHHPALGFITIRGYPKACGTSAWRSCPTTFRVGTNRGPFPLRTLRGDCFYRGSWNPTKRRTSMGVQQKLEEPTERSRELEVNDSHVEGLQDQGQPNRQAEDRPQKSLLGKAADVVRNTFNALMGAATLASIFLAAQTLWELHGTPLTLTNAVPTLSKLLPLTGIGVFGAAQLVGLLARVIRVIVTLPIMISGTWVILQNAPQLLPKGSDLSGAGSVLAVLATPEALEAAAVLAFLGGMVLWALNMSRMIFGALIGKAARDDES